MNNNLLLVTIIIAGLAVGFFYYTNSSSDFFIAPPLDGKIDDLSIFANLNLDISGLESGKLKNFKIFGESPVNPGDTGKINPFAPI